MNTPAPIEVIKPGRHTAMSGSVFELSESELLASVAAYDPKLHEAPLVVGHPKVDAPAYGWAKSLSFADGVMQAEPDQVDPEFAELVKAGRFKKVSGSFFHPDSPNNPVPGVYYLRHIGFLGAMPPAVKGLKSVSFAENDEGIVEFGDWADINNSSLWRSLRDWVIAKFGLEEADKAVPPWSVQSLADSAAQPEGQPGAFPSFSEEPTQKGDEMSAEDKARLAALEEENRQLKVKEAQFAEAETKRKRDAAHDEHANFAEGLVKDGKLLPAQKLVAVAAMDLVAGQDTPVEFGEGDDKVPLTVDSIKTLLKSLPKQVDFSEHAGNEKDTSGLSDAEIASRAREYKGRKDAAGENISFAEAVDAVTAGQDK